MVLRIVRRVGPFSSAVVLPTREPDCFVVAEGGHLQSHVDLHDPTRLVFDYVRRIGDVLDAVAPAGQPVRVVHVGGGGLTLPRYVVATRPGSHQVVLEPDADLVELVRRELPLPRRSGIRIRPVDGATGLPTLRESAADVVVLDAYDGDRMPPELVTLEQCAQLRRVLGEQGLLVANVVDRAPFAWARRVLAGLTTVLPQVAVGAETAVWNGKREGNLLVVAGAGPLPAGVPVAGQDYRVRTGGAVRDALGGGVPVASPRLA
jgi:hypothetical protein